MIFRMTSCRAIRLRVSLSSILLSSPLAISNAVAQQAAEPVPLDAITVESQKTKKKSATQAKGKPKAVAKSAPATAPPSPAPDVVNAAPAEPPSGTGKATKPGLNLENPNTGGSRLNLTPLQTPASIEVISGDTVRERGQTSVNQAVIQNATGFTSPAAPGNGGTTLAARGFAGHGSVMQLYDGTRLAVGSGTVTFPFSTWSADRIEVLRGPASVIYGEGAIGGGVNVVPRKPTDVFINEAEIAVGTDSTKRFGIGSGGPINDKWAYRIDASGHQSNGWLDREGDFSALALSGALRWKPTSKTSLTLSHDYGHQSPLRYWGTPLINGRVDDRIRHRSYNVADSEVKYIDNWTQIKAEWHAAPWLTFRSTGYRLTSDRHWRNTEDYAYNSGTGLIARTSYIEIFHDQEQIGNRSDATLRMDFGNGIKNDVVVGFDVSQIDFRHANNSRPPSVPSNQPSYLGSSFVDPFNFDLGVFLNGYGTRPRSATDTTQTALFMEDRLQLSRQVSLIGGVRHDRAELDRNEPANAARCAFVSSLRANILNGLTDSQPEKIQVQRNTAPQIRLETTADALAAAGSANDISFAWVGGRAVMLARGRAGTALRDAVTGSPLAIADDVLIAAARRMYPDDAVVSARRLTEETLYWYSHHNKRALPAIEVRFDDPARTSVFLDPATASIAGFGDTSSRTYRWLFAFLHDYDLPVLLRHRPARVVLIWLLSLAGLIVSVSGVVIGWRTLRRSVR
jgi:outer membrane receptor protein involved in Fe transport